MTESHHIPPTGPGTDEPKRWLDDKANLRKLAIALFVLCAALFLADAFYVKHPVHWLEETFGFYALYAFVVGVALVLGAKLIRVFLKRDEDYYDRDG
ncbi:MAG: hypothetical protein ISP41_17430 [Alphaproteobacteria bacterium]|jgi:hypothetical protein|nr:hypothetical protein [Alphaproteobacteria bacterium]